MAMVVTGSSGASGQTGEPHAELVLVEFHLLAAGQTGAPTSHLVISPPSDHRFARPEMHVHVQGVALAREAGVVGAAAAGTFSACRWSAVAVHPLAHRGQDAHRFFGDRAVRLGADIQQIVAGIVRAR